MSLTFLRNHGSGPTGKSVRHIEANFLVPAVLEGLEPTRYDNILIVACESLADEAHGARPRCQLT